MKTKKYAYRLGTAVFVLMLIPLLVAGIVIIAETSPETGFVASAPLLETTETTEKFELEETVPTIEEITPSEPESTESTLPVVITPELTEPSVEVTLPSQEINWYSKRRVYPLNTITKRAGGTEIDIDFLAKLLYCEAGDMTKLGKIYTCSAILNFCDEYNLSIWSAGHNKDCFAVAPYVDEAEPTVEEYEVIDYVLNGGRIDEICHFRTRRYHKFGIPVCEIDGHYFSIKEK